MTHAQALLIVEFYADAADARLASHGPDAVQIYLENAYVAAVRAANALA